MPETKGGASGSRAAKYQTPSMQMFRRLPFGREGGREEGADRNGTMCSIKSARGLKNCVLNLYKVLKL